MQGMPRLFLFTLLFGLLSYSASAQTCIDIRRFDFKNAAIHVSESDANELQTLFNASRGDARTFHLRDGVGLTYDFPESNPQTPDWRTELITDREAHPEPTIWIRVIGLEDDHLTGTGTWHYVLAFSCEKGHLVRKFQFSAEGVHLKHLDDQTLQLGQGIWISSDSHADPSRERELTYKWDAQLHQYRLTSKTSPTKGKPKH